MYGADHLVLQVQMAPNVLIPQATTTSIRTSHSKSVSDINHMTGSIIQERRKMHQRWVSGLAEPMVKIEVYVADMLIYRSQTVLIRGQHYLAVGVKRPNKWNHPVPDVKGAFLLRRPSTVRGSKVARHLGKRWARHNSL